MCGIAGILNFAGRPVIRAEIESLTDAIAHRGRDSAKVVMGGMDSESFSSYAGIALGHRRLSILDLSAEASQPMASLDARAWIVYNGELYNYKALRSELVQLGCRFRSQTDSEVVLMAYLTWGEACLERFNGMFAFAIWNESEQSLFCARDPLGIKPFYYSLDSQSFRFASESAALVKGRALELDQDAVASYFLSMYVPRRMSMFAGVHKLLPGHAMRLTRDGMSVCTAYWHTPAVGQRNLSVDDAAEELQALLDRAVASQLQSDVPVGALLSGGFDSGMIVAAASRTHAPLHTYSVGFDDGRQFNELPLAKELAQRYGTIHHERVIRGEEVISLLDRSIGCMSEPVADTAMVPTFCLSEMAANDGVKVLLSGTGGDEVFAGYSRYVRSSRSRQFLYRLPPGLRALLGRAMSRGSLLGARLRHPSLDMMLYTGGSTSLARHFFRSKGGLNLFLDNLAQNVFPKPDAQVQGLYANMLFDLQVYLPDQLLLLLDQVTMAHTIEGRVPLLDIDLIAASYSLPARLHASQNRTETRCLMRKMAAGQLAAKTFTAQKQGFSGPVTSWIDSHSQRFQDVLMDARSIPALNGLPLEILWQQREKSSGRVWAMEVFSVYCFANWYRAHEQ